MWKNYYYLPWITSLIFLSDSMVHCGYNMQACGKMASQKEATIISLTLEITKEYSKLTLWVLKNLLTNAFYFI